MGCLTRGFGRVNNELNGPAGQPHPLSHFIPDLRHSLNWDTVTVGVAAAATSYTLLDIFVVYEIKAKAMLLVQVNNNGMGFSLLNGEQQSR